MSRSAVSQHLKVLEDAGLVAEEAVGTRRMYHLEEAAVLALRDQLDTFWDRAGSHCATVSIVTVVGRSTWRVTRTPSPGTDS